jgi:methionyl-tRNA synthetase
LWLLREVPRVGDAVFTRDRLVARADADFAGGLGNLVHRVVTMVHRFRGGAVPALGADRFAVATLLEVCGAAPGGIDAALADHDFRRAVQAAWSIVEEANRCIDATRPWELARAERQGNADAAERLDAVLAALVTACRVLGDELQPFVPEAAARIAERVTAVDGVLPPTRPLFPRLGAP